MTKSIIAQRKQRNESKTYEQRLKKFLGEFGIKDTWEISDKQHKALMEDHFYWIDKESSQGYHIHDDIEEVSRKLSEEEASIYQDLYYDATRY
jgi:hypothetical protein